MGKRQAIVKLSRQDLENLLVLPANMRVVTTRDDWAFSGILVLVEGDELDEIPEAAEPPVLRGEWRLDPVTGKLWWGGNPDA